MIKEQGPKEKFSLASTQALIEQAKILSQFGVESHDQRLGGAFNLMRQVERDKDKLLKKLAKEQQAKTFCRECDSAQSCSISTKKESFAQSICLFASKEGVLGAITRQGFSPYLN